VDSRLVLPVNTVLDGSYRIMRVVGSGGFGITYEAEDTGLGTMVAVKEYYPFDFGDRDSTMSVRPKSERHKQTFDWGRTNFLQEARTLARFEHPSIVRVTRVFEANATAYMVMRFEQGRSLESWLNNLDRAPTQEELDSIIAPMLDALELMHAANFLHRDIAPDNIIVRNDGTPVLLDFGAARRAVAEMSRMLTGIVKAGYSPHEQYSSDGRLQGPWSDIYALGGTLYRAVTGKPPEEATLRFDEDHMASAAKAAKGKYRRDFLSAIDTCLKVRHSERPRSVAQLRPMLLGRRSAGRGPVRLVEPTVKLPSLRTPSLPSLRMPSVASIRTSVSKLGSTLSGLPKKLPPDTVQKVTRRWPAIAATVAILAGAYGGYEYQRWSKSDGGASTAEVERLSKEAETIAQRRAAAEAAVQRQAALEAEKRRKDREAADARQRQSEIEEARRRKVLTDAAEAEARRKAEADDAAKRKEEQRLAALAEEKRKAEEVRRKEEQRVAALAEEKRKAEEARRKSEADAEARRKEEQRIAALDETRRKEEQRIAALAEEKRKADEARRNAETEAETKRKEEQRVAALEEEKRMEAERVRLAVVPDDTKRAEFVRQIQQVLKRMRCYDGAVNGNSGGTQQSLDRFVENAAKKGSAKPERIELAKATVGDFESWLKDAGAIKGTLCAPQAKPQTSEPTPRARQEQRPQRQYTQPRPSSRPSGVGTIQGIQ
jgi:serine/threonine protein kinase